MSFVFLSMTILVVLYARFNLSHNCFVNLVLVVAFMSALWVPKYRLTESWDFCPYIR